MKPLERRAPPKRQGLIRRPVRTRMDASAELLRLEYERDKLTRQLSALKDRFGKIEGEIDRVAARAAWLHAFLDADRAPAVATLADAAANTIAVTVNVPVSALPRRRTRAAASSKAVAS